MEPQKFPGMMKQVNDGLDELIQAVGKVGALYESARQMSPVLDAIQRLMAAMPQRPGGEAQVRAERTPRSGRRTTSGRRRATSRGRR